ncbi:hypothetical protein VTN31DRAFT_3014 [Thermomyces dupontii]|uniref:uncharacterized protein n=1 Tax=Talaromyces thermophilus TaxID=28565 RepID=UPI003742665E
MAVQSKTRCAVQASGIIARGSTRWASCSRFVCSGQPGGGFTIVLFYIASLAFAACSTVPVVRLSAFMGLSCRLLLWLLIVWKGFGSWNNVFDPFIIRTTLSRIRPVSGGVVRIPQEYFVSGLHMVLGALLLSRLPTPSRIYARILSTVLFAWPLAKKVPYNREIVTGFGFCMAFLQCCATLGVIRFGQGDVRTMGAAFSMAAMYLIAVAIANVVYACQDRRNDLKVGASSLAIQMGSHVKTWLWVFSIAMEGLLINAGIQCRFSPFFFIISCGWTLLALVAMLLNIDLRVKQSCNWWLRAGTMSILASIAAGMLVEYGLKLKKSKQ